MPCLRYKVMSPIRLLLPLSGLLFVIPFILEKDLLLYTTLPLSYFAALYFCLLNFPGVAESLHKKPLYLEDLKLERLESNTPDLTFQYIYSIIMNFLLAALFAGLSEYIILQPIREKPIIEVAAIIGGNLTLYYKIQGIIGKIILKLCYYCKTRVSSSPEIEIIV